MPMFCQCKILASTLCYKLSFNPVLSIQLQLFIINIYFISANILHTPVPSLNRFHFTLSFVYRYPQFVPAMYYKPELTTITLEEMEK